MPLPPRRKSPAEMSRQSPRAGTTDASIGPRMGAGGKEGFDGRFGVVHAGFRRPQRGARRHGWLARVDERAIDELESLDAVPVSLRFERRQLAPFAFVVRDDQFAALHLRHIV